MALAERGKGNQEPHTHTKPWAAGMIPGESLREFPGGGA